jgi:acyl-CoA dehydrogenase
VRADFYVTAVRTCPEPGHGSLSFLVIEAGDGVRASPLEKLGWHASDTAEIAFEDVAVPDDALLGEEGRGFYLIVANSQWERLPMSLGAVGSMRATLERVIPILAERGVSQSVRHRVAEHAVAAEMGAAMTYQGLRRFLDGGDAVREVTMAKLLTQRANFELQDACYGMLADLGHPAAEDLARAARDARLGPIGGGTDEIMKEILGKTLGL